MSFCFGASPGVAAAAVVLLCSLAFSAALGDADKYPRCDIGRPDFGSRPTKAVGLRRARPIENQASEVADLRLDLDLAGAPFAPPVLRVIPGLRPRPIFLAMARRASE